MEENQPGYGFKPGTTPLPVDPWGGDSAVVHLDETSRAHELPEEASDGPPRAPLAV